MQRSSPRVEPLLPTAALPSSPARPTPPFLASRQRVRRVLLAALVAFCVLNAAWATRALYHAWHGRSREWQQVGKPPAEGGAASGGSLRHGPAKARGQVASAADHAVTAALDAGQVLSSAAGAEKHGAKAAANAAWASLTVAAPVAAKAAIAVGGAAKEAAAAVGSAAKDAATSAGSAAKGAVVAVGSAAQEAASRMVASGSSERGGTKPAGEPQPQGEKAEAEDEGGRKAELLAPVVDTASGDACAQAVGLNKVALMFLVRGELHHEAAWRRWFASARGLLPAAALETALCSTADADRRQAIRRQAVQSACAPRHNASSTAAAGAAAATAAGTAVPAATIGAGLAAAAAAGPIWQQHLFSVYVHAPPDFKGYPAGSMWEGHLIPRRIPTGWGSITLVEATRNLLWEAFRDPLNQRFVLLSESDVPLYDPLTLHQQLLAEDKSRVNACPHNGRHEWRWSSKMVTEHMNISHWRKSTQWIGLTRGHAEAVLRDEEVYRSFEAHCWSNWEPSRGGWRDCFPDEHYFATLLAVLGRESEAECGTWGVAAQDWSRGGAHPKSYRPHEVTPELLHQIRGQECSGEAAYADAQKMYVDAADVLAPNATAAACGRLRDVAATATYAHPLNASACHLTARKFPVETAKAVLTLFDANISCSLTSTAGPAAAVGCQRGSSDALHLLTEHYCQMQQEGRGQQEQGEAVR